MYTEIPGKATHNSIPLDASAHAGSNVVGSSKPVAQQHSNAPEASKDHLHPISVFQAEHHPASMPMPALYSVSMAMRVAKLLAMTSAKMENVTRRMLDASFRS